MTNERSSGFRRLPPGGTVRRGIRPSPEELNRAECKAARDKAIDRVEEHANDTWIELAYSIVEQLATTSLLPFTAEDVWKILETSYPEVTTTDRRAMGAIMRRAKRDGIAMPTGMYVPSALKNRHCGPVRVWKSVPHQFFVGGES